MVREQYDPDTPIFVETCLGPSMGSVFISVLRVLKNMYSLISGKWLQNRSIEFTVKSSNRFFKFVLFLLSFICFFFAFITL